MLNTFNKALIRADILENIARMIDTHSYKFYPDSIDVSGNVRPYDEEDAYRIQFIETIKSALEKLL